MNVFSFVRLKKVASVVSIEFLETTMFTICELLSVNYYRFWTTKFFAIPESQLETAHHTIMRTKKTNNQRDEIKMRQISTTNSHPSTLLQIGALSIFYINSKKHILLLEYQLSPVPWSSSRSLLSRFVVIVVKNKHYLSHIRPVPVPGGL